MSYGFKEIMRQIDDARKVQDMSRDPFGSHDGMDIDPRTAVVETCGYGYRNEVSSPSASTVTCIKRPRRKSTTS